MTRIIVSLMLLGCVVSTARADPYWIAYEGNDFPENEGWTRITNGPLAERWIEDGALVIDATEETSTCDWYEMYPEITAPEAGEEFILQWRLKIEEFTGGWLGTTVGVFADDQWAVAFTMNHDTIRSSFESEVSAQYEPDIYHEYELRSSDMRTYEMYIDGVYAFEGEYWQSIMSNTAGWGETTTGSSCLSTWDYVRLGIIPEPNSGVAMLALMLTFLTRRICC